MKFLQLISSFFSLHQRMDEKLVQFQEEVRLRQEDVADAKAMKKARYDHGFVSYSIHLVSFLGHLLPMLTW